MANVYRQANSVLIWLGEGDQTTTAALKSIDLLVEQCRKIVPTTEDQVEMFFDANMTPVSSEQVLPEDCDYVAITNFYSTDWFTRLWVVQEVMLNDCALFFCGSHFRPWQDVCLAAQWLHYAQYPDFRYCGSFVHGIEISSQLWRFDSQDSDFTNLLHMSIQMEATMSLDKIYGMLGLMDSESLSTMTPAITAPDYRHDLAKVFAAATRTAMVKRNDAYNQLQVLSWAQLLVPRTSTAADGTTTDNNTANSSDWPSWVPRFDWNHTLDDGSPALVLSLVNSVASGCTGIVESVPDISEASMILRLNGVTIDKTTALERVFDLDLMDFPENGIEFALVFLQCRELAINTQRCADNLHLFFTNRCDRYNLDATQSPEHLHDYELFVQHCQEDPLHIWAYDEHDRNYGDAIWKNNANRRMFVTANGFIGMGPAKMKVGDKVCILFGGEIPFVLRQEGEYYRLVGTAYVHGIMEGEYIQQLEAEGRLEAETIEFAIN